jgi:hypothetical protein
LLETGAAAARHLGSAEQGVVDEVVNTAQDVLDDISDVDVSMEAQREVQSVSVPMAVAAVTEQIAPIEQVAEKAAVAPALVVAVLVTMVRLCLVSIRFVVSVAVVLLVMVVLVVVASEHGVPFG